MMPFARIGRAAFTRGLATLTIVLATSMALPQDAPTSNDPQQQSGPKQGQADQIAESQEQLLELIRQRDQKIEELESRLAAIERQLQQLLAHFLLGPLLLSLPCAPCRPHAQLGPPTPSSREARGEPPWWSWLGFLFSVR